MIFPNALRALILLHISSLGATAVPPAVPTKSPLSLNLPDLPIPLFNTTNLTAISTGFSFRIPGTGLTLNLLDSQESYPLSPPDVNLCIANALVDMFSLLYLNHKDTVLPVGYRASYRSVHFAIVENTVFVASSLMLSDAVLVLKMLALIEIELGYKARAMGVMDDRRGHLCFAMLLN